ncbi:hypothetical protein JCM10449v2_001361 [Rhodotorula kratochvilovae]
MPSVPESNAFLAYGVTVTTESLLYAVAAWPSLQGPFAFLDLVQLRRNNGTLSATQPRSDFRSVIELVPSDVWDVVRHKLVDLELREAEIAHVRSLACPTCHNGQRAESLSWEGLLYDMLTTFGLALPTPIPIHLSNDDDDASSAQPEADPCTATMISLLPPSAGGDDAFGTHAHCGGDSGPDQQVIVDVSVKVPPDATARFRRLVSQLHLQLVDVTDGVLANACSKKVKGKTKLRHDKRQCKEVPLAKIKPGWKLITMAKTTW